MTTKALKIPRKYEKPRPLKSMDASRLNSINVEDGKRSPQAEIDELLSLMENFQSELANYQTRSNQVEESIGRIYSLLKVWGHELEYRYLVAIDSCFVAFRWALRQNCFSQIAIYRLLELVELRAAGWKQNENTAIFYQDLSDKLLNGLELNKSTSHFEESLNPAFPSNSSSPNEVLHSSGKFPKPTKIAGKNCYKDEIVIKNSDSGKVNAGAKERLVQISGNNGEAIGLAKNLIEDTIQRNASPDRERLVLDNGNYLANSYGQEEESIIAPNSLSNGNNDVSYPEDAETRYTIRVGADRITISGENKQLVKECQEVLEDFYQLKANKNLTLLPNSNNLDGRSYNDQQNDNYILSGSGDFQQETLLREETMIPDIYYQSADNDVDQPEKSKIVYSRQFILDCFHSPMSVSAPPDLQWLKKELPMIVRPVPATTLPADILHKRI